MRKSKLFLCLILIALSVAAQDADSVYKPVEYPEGFTSQLNIVYTKVKDWEGRTDFYLPPKSSDR